MDSRSFQLPISHDRALSVRLEGRTPFEKRMQTEETALQTAAADQVVAIELYFHQFWRPLGHTSLRIGSSLYELTMSGWKVHGGGADNPRAFLFNNPFFRKQMRRFEPYGMKPLSLGLTLYLPKSTVDKMQTILENKCAAHSLFKKERFNILTNNCNHGIMGVLKMCDIPGFEDSGLEGFSSVISFNRLLSRSTLQSCSKVGYGPLRAYPLPGYKLSTDQAASWVYPWLYQEKTKMEELRRALPLYFHTYWILLKLYLKGLITNPQ